MLTIELRVAMKVDLVRLVKRALVLMHVILLLRLL